MITKKMRAWANTRDPTLEFFIGSFSREVRCFHWLISKGGADVIQFVS